MMGVGKELVLGAFSPIEKSLTQSTMVHYGAVKPSTVRRWWLVSCTCCVVKHMAKQGVNW